MEGKMNFKRFAAYTLVLFTAFAAGQYLQEVIPNDQMLPKLKEIYFIRSE